MFYSLSALLIILLPLACFIVLSLFGKRIRPAISGLIGCFSLVVSALLALYVAYGYFFEFGKHDTIFLRQIVMQFQWLRLNDSLSIDFGIVLDPISVMMLVVISLISAMIHIYSLNYMHGEEQF